MIERMRTHKIGYMPASAIRCTECKNDLFDGREGGEKFYCEPEDSKRENEETAVKAGTYSHKRSSLFLGPSEVTE